MDLDDIDVKLLILIISIAALATCQQQTRSSFQSVQPFQSLNKFTNRLWALWRRKSWKSGNANEYSKATVLVSRTKHFFENKFKSKIPTNIGRRNSIVSKKNGLNSDYERLLQQRQFNATTTSTTIIASTSTTTSSTSTASSTSTTTPPTSSIASPTTQSNGTIALNAIAAAAVAIAAALAVAVPTSLQAASQSNSQNSAQQANLQNLFGGGGGVGLGDNQTPTNNLPLPVNGIDFQDDGCGDGSVRFGDGNCYSVLKRGPCADPHRWLTVDPIQLQVIQLICENIETNLTKDAFQGQCTPRLCGRGRVFVGRDGLCHDVNDPLECQGGRRLYYSSYGDSICDCPIGQYPFPTVQDDCVPLFTQGIARKMFYRFNSVK